MNYNKLELFVSTARLGRYLRACGNSKTKALELYKANLLLSGSFYPIMNYFEIFFRNMINREIVGHLQNPRWIIDEKQGFMSDPVLTPTHFYLRNSVQKAENELRRRRMHISAAGVLAEQTFGFWTSFFEPEPYRVLQGAVMNCFPLKPPAINRRALRAMLKDIRSFRNRIYHNEPICFDNGSISFVKLEKTHADIYNLLDWMDSELANHVRFFDRIPKQLLTAKRI